MITGGAGGIGLAISRSLRSAGATVWILDAPEKHPEDTGASFAADGIPLDLADREALTAAFDRIEKLDYLVVANDLQTPHSLNATTAEEWSRSLAVNLTGTFHAMQLAAAKMKTERRGSIVLLSAASVQAGESDFAAYNASKAGLQGLLRTAANELGPYGIRVNAVAPGLIRMPANNAMFSNRRFSRDYFRNVPLGRGGSPEEVAAAVLFLLSDAASYITGTELLVDGGQTAAKSGTWNEDRSDFFGDRWWMR